MKYPRLVLGGAVGAAVVISVAGYFALRTPKTNYRYLTVAPRNLEEIVKVNGTTDAASDVEMSFERSGRVAQVLVTTGQAVKVGQILVTLDNGNEASMVAQTQALLNLKIAGATQSDIAYYQAAADAAKADYDKAVADTKGTVNAAQAALDVAQNNLQLANGKDTSLLTKNAYDNILASLQGSMSIMDNAMTQADNILAVDNPLSNDSFKDYLGSLNPSALPNAKFAYTNTKNLVVATRASIALLSGSSDHATIDATVSSTLSTLTSISNLLTKVSDVLSATPPVGNLNQAALDQKKSTIVTTRSGVTGQYAVLLANKQAVSTAGTSLDTYTIAYQKAQNDLATAQASATSLVALKQAAYEQALANLTSKTQAPREVDLAPLRASLEQAQVAYGKTVLRAPIDGVVGKIDAKVGELVSPNVPIVSVIDPTHYELKAQVSEADVSEVHVGEVAEVTLDAYAGLPFQAQVIALDQAPSTIENQPGYQVTLQFIGNDPRLKPGLTASAAITTSLKNNVLAVPDRSVLKRGTNYVVLLKTNREPTERQVTVGIKSKDDWREILGGLSPGDEVVQF